MEDEVALAHGAMLSGILALAATWGAFSADRVLSKWHPNLGRALRAFTDTHFLCLEHLKTGAALSADLWIDSITSEASWITKIARPDLALGRLRAFPGHSDASWAHIHACIREIVEVSIGVARCTKVG